MNINFSLTSQNSEKATGSVWQIILRSIELEPNFATYINRALAKRKLEDYYGAIADYTKAIELDLTSAVPYVGRGWAKTLIDDYAGGISDFNKAIELDPNYATAYNNRGVAKNNLGDLRGACEDWKKAANHGHPDAAKWVKEECN